MASTSLSLNAAETSANPPRDFAAVYRQHLDPVYRYVLARVGDVQDAQDITAHIFLTAAESFRAYRGQGAVAAWLFGIARHKVADHFRRAYRNQPLVSLDDAEDVSESDEDTPDLIVARKLQIEAVARAMQALTPDRAEAIALHLFGDLAIHEVAVLMDKSDAAIKMLLQRGLRDLRARLASNEGERE